MSVLALSIPFLPSIKYLTPKLNIDLALLRNDDR